MDREFMRTFYREFREHTYDEAVKDSVDSPFCVSVRAVDN